MPISDLPEKEPITDHHQQHQQIVCRRHLMEPFAQLRKSSTMVVPPEDEHNDPRVMPTNAPDILTSRL